MGYINGEYEIYYSVDENNKRLALIHDYPICFSCKQGRLHNFYKYYLNMTKHERMKCLLCVSGLKQIAKPKLGSE